ncbi:MAG TPA: M1 family metallopeptidase [Gemmatimonadaceae bacterium]
MAAALAFAPALAALPAGCRPAPPPPPPAPIAVDTTPPPAPPPNYVVFREGPLVAWGAPPAGTAREPRRRSFDLRHQIVRVRADWARHAIVGTTTLTIAALDTAIREIALDAVGMRIGGVRGAPGGALRHDYDGRSLVAHLAAPLAPGATVRLTIDYETERPKKGAYFVDRRRVLWTQGEPEDTRHWVPTWDHPSDRTTWEIVARVRRGEKALSNGRLVSTRRVGDEDEWHWRLDQPAPTYLMSLVTGDYVVLQDTWRTVPIAYWTYADSVEAAWRGFGKTPRMMDFFGERTGVPYPWAKYDQSVVPDFVFGGMENVTATTQSDDRILHPAWAEPQANAELLVAHELAHQWFGGLVTARDWPDIWLNEGFATYFALDWAAESFGADEGAYRRLEAQEQAIAADRAARRPLVHDRWVHDPLELFLSGHVYPKGAAVLFMLRRELGDSLFRSALAAYARAHAYESATTGDFRASVEEATGRDLDRFFAQWVHGAGFPAFRITAAYDSVARRLSLVASQVQPRDTRTGLFSADVDVAVGVADSIVRRTVSVRDSVARLELVLSGAPRWIRWDAGGWLLDVTDFPRPTAMLVAQREEDPDVLGRVEAVMLLGERPRDSLAVLALADAARSDAFRGVRERAATRLVALLRADSLGDAGRRSAALAAVRDALDDADARVRVAAAAGIGAFAPAERERLAARALADPSRFVRVAAVQALASADTAAAMPEIRRMLGTDSWRDVERVGALAALGEIEGGDAQALLAEHLAAAHGGAARRTALASLVRRARAGRADSASAERTAALGALLVPLLDDRDPFLRQDAARALGRLGVTSAIPALERRRAIEPEGRVLTDIDAALAALRGG